MPAGATYASQLRDVDISNAGSGTDLYLLRYEDASGKVKLVDPSTVGVTDHGALSGLTDDDHTQYLLATGTRAGATSQAQAFTNGVVTGVIKPPSDSTTAVKITNAAGSADVLTVDTTNSAATLAGSLTLQSAATTSLTLDSDGSAQLVLDSNGTFDTSSVNLKTNDGTGFFVQYDNNHPTFPGHLRIISANNFTAFVANSNNMLEVQSNGIAIVRGTPLHTATAQLDLTGSSTERSPLRLRIGTAPTSPNDGDIWYDGSDLHIRIGGTTYTLDKTSV